MKNNLKKIIDLKGITTRIIVLLIFNIGSTIYTKLNTNKTVIESAISLPIWTFNFIINILNFPIRLWMILLVLLLLIIYFVQKHNKMSYIQKEAVKRAKELREKYSQNLKNYKYIKKNMPNEDYQEKSQVSETKNEFTSPRLNVLDWKYYTMDEIKGKLFKWKYSSINNDDITARDLTHICSSCLCELSYDGSTMIGLNGTELSPSYCPNCGNKENTLDKSELSDIRKLIKHRIETSEYKESKYFKGADKP